MTHPRVFSFSPCPHVCLGEQFHADPTPCGVLTQVRNGSRRSLVPDGYTRPSCAVLMARLPRWTVSCCACLPRHACMIILRACWRKSLGLRPSFTLVWTGPNGRIDGLRVTVVSSCYFYSSLLGKSSWNPGSHKDTKMLFNFNTWVGYGLSFVHTGQTKLYKPQHTAKWWKRLGKW